jgi:hypothetical protein
MKRGNLFELADGIYEWQCFSSYETRYLPGDHGRRVCFLVTDTRRERSTLADSLPLLRNFRSNLNRIRIVVRDRRM